jgi:hypothetical protein
LIKLIYLLPHQKWNCLSEWSADDTADIGYRIFVKRWSFRLLVPFQVLILG